MIIYDGKPQWVLLVGLDNPSTWCCLLVSIKGNAFDVEPHFGGRVNSYINIAFSAASIATLIPSTSRVALDAWGIHIKSNFNRNLKWLVHTWVMKAIKKGGKMARYDLVGYTSDCGI